jgi:hypothetical protein
VADEPEIASMGLVVTSGNIVLDLTASTADLQIEATSIDLDIEAS